MTDKVDEMMKDAGFNLVNPHEQKGTEAKPEIKTDAKTEDVKPSEDDKTKVEDNKDVQANNSKEEVKEQPYDLDSFNKAFKKDFKSVDDITNLFGLSDEYDSVKAQLETKDREILDKDTALKEKYNPMSYFADEQEFKINQILKNDKDLNRNIVSRLVYSNLNELKDEDVLKLNDLLKTKGTFDEKIVEMDIKDRYGLNINREEADDEVLKAIPLKEYRMKKDADDARNSLAKLLEIELPEYKDPSVLAQEKDAADLATFNENKQKWDVFTKEFVSKFNKLPVEYSTDDNKKAVFEFDVDDEFKDAILKNLPMMAATNNKDLSNEADVKMLVDQVQKDLWWLRKDRYLKVAIEDTLSKMTEEEMKRYYNPSKPKEEEAPVTLSDENRFNQAQQEKMKKDFKIK